MNEAHKILIIEDEKSDFEVIYRNLPNYERYPATIEEFNIFKMHLRGWLEKIEQQRIDDAETFFKNYFDKDFVAIILDIRLGLQKNDTSGLEFLSFLRGRFFPLTPIIMLSSLNASAVKSGLTNAAGLANYYLHKGGGGDRLSEDFFSNELKPVLAMLETWFKMITPKIIINDILQNYTHQVINCLDEKFGTVQSQIDLLKASISDLNELAKINLGILRFSLKTNNRSAGRLADLLIDEFELTTMIPQLEKFKPSLVQKLRDNSDNIKKILKGEIEKELFDYIKSFVRDLLCLGDDDPIMKEVLIILYNFTKKHIKTLIIP